MQRMCFRHLCSIDRIFGCVRVYRMLIRDLSICYWFNCMCRMRCWEIFRRSRRIFIDGLRELRSGTIATRDRINRLRSVRCGSVPNGPGRVELRELLCGLLFGRYWYNRKCVPKLRGGSIPNCVGIIGLHGLHGRKLFDFDGLDNKRMFKLRNRQVRDR